MNLAPRWQTTLAAEGIEAVHWSAVGAATAADHEIMAHAVASNAIVLTHDLDFGAILAASAADKPSVIQLRSDDVRPEACAEAVVAALRQLESELSVGALVTVDAARFRITLLPLSR